MRRSSFGDDSYEMPRPCPRGTWSGAGAVKCTKCAKGYYTWDEASSYCDRCEAGYMCSAPDADPEPCPLGTYSAEPAQTCCTVYTTTTVSTSTVTEIDACMNVTHCLNGGTCKSNGTISFTCICPDTYYGERCEKTTDEQTILEVFTRNNWTDVLAVIDVTGSMHPCAETVSQWMSLAHEKTNIKTYVFFNDGDSKADKDKVIGSTGGIYATDSTNLSVVRTVMETAMRMGGGGDGPENDIEALLYGIKRCPTCQNVIHIADNQVIPRDLILLADITMPIKVIPCQVHPAGGVNPALINVADKTGGSLHTIEQDIIYLSGIAVGQTIDIGHFVYRRTNNGFIRI
ncbi:unnamed protein product [Adineta steineri]|uniref:EGF-like domain-containing protein n=1 Tax=Adineta steineri TaxID=433720 RepID=A0A819WP39_9BILA|nr:unnamed protein product [Adineta steineri]